MCSIIFCKLSNEKSVRTARHANVLKVLIDMIAASVKNTDNFFLYLFESYKYAVSNIAYKQKSILAKTDNAKQVPHIRA
ncbi:MAG: hypothetical protein HON23_07525 [Rickettsiales bacterium]|nr:hypothetical protein [Rickettsiales bacterium]